MSNGAWIQYDSAKGGTLGSMRRGVGRRGGPVDRPALLAGQQGRIGAQETLVLLVIESGSTWDSPAWMARNWASVESIVRIRWKS